MLNLPELWATESSLLVTARLHSRKGQDRLCALQLPPLPLQRSSLCRRGGGVFPFPLSPMLRSRNTRFAGVLRTLSAVLIVQSSLKDVLNKQRHWVPGLLSAMSRVKQPTGIALCSRGGIPARGSPCLFSMPVHARTITRRRHSSIRSHAPREPSVREICGEAESY